MHKHILSFRAFLVIYLCFLIYHTIHIEFVSWIQIVALCIGFILALIAHSRQGYATVLLLLLHMAIEWSEYAQHTTPYSEKELLFYGIHILLDVVFLWQELGAHMSQVKWKILGGATLILIAVTLYSSFNTVTLYSETTSIVFEMLVIGGIFGCTLTHLFQRKLRR